MSYLDTLTTDCLFCITNLLPSKDTLTLSRACKSLRSALSSEQYYTSRALCVYGIKDNASIVCKYLDKEQALACDDEEFDIELEFLLLKDTKKHAIIAYSMIKSGIINFMSTVNGNLYLQSIKERTGTWHRVKKLVRVILNEHTSIGLYGLNDWKQRECRRNYYGLQ